MPSISLRAVRMMPGPLDDRASRRRQRGSIAASNVPVGCSSTTARRGAARASSSPPAILAGARPWRPTRRRARRSRRGTRCGMNVRVHRSPPSRGGATERQLRHAWRGHVAEVHHGPGLQADLLETLRAAAASASSSSGDSYAGDADVGGTHHDDGHPVVDQRARRRRRSRRRELPGRQQRPARAAGDVVEVEPDRRGRTGDAVDRRVTAVRASRAVRAGKWPSRVVGVDHVDAHDGSRHRCGASRPRSIANGPTPASRLPQFWRSVTTAGRRPSCRNR